MPFLTQRTYALKFQNLKVNSGFHTVLLGNQLTEKRMNDDPNFLLSLSKKGGGTIFSGGGGVPLQQYTTKISLYGAKKPSTRVTEVGDVVDVCFCVCFVFFPLASHE